MDGNILRSVIAIPSGWVVAVAGDLATMLVIALFDSPVNVRPGEPVSTAWLLVSLPVCIVWSVVAGFATGAIARRSEIKHGIGLILFTFAVCAFSWFLGRHKSSAVQVPTWYQIASLISLIPSVLLGAWLRMRRKTLAQKVPAGVAGTANDLWLSIKILVDQFRFPTAVVVSFVVVLGGTFVGKWLTVIGLLVVRAIFGVDLFSPAVCFLCMTVFFFLSCVLARRLFKKIVAVDTSLMEDVG